MDAKEQRKISPSGHENHHGVTCSRCGWPYPNPHPSAKHRRAHKKICGKVQGFKVIDSDDNNVNLAGSDDEDDRQTPVVEVSKIDKRDSGVFGEGSNSRSEDDSFSDAATEFSDSAFSPADSDKKVEGTAEGDLDSSPSSKLVASTGSPELLSGSIESNEVKNLKGAENPEVRAVEDNSKDTKETEEYGMNDFLANVPEHHIRNLSESSEIEIKSQVPDGFTSTPFAEDEYTRSEQVQCGGSDLKMSNLPLAVESIHPGKENSAQDIDVSSLDDLKVLDKIKTDEEETMYNLSVEEDIPVMGNSDILIEGFKDHGTVNSNIPLTLGSAEVIRPLGDGDKDIVDESSSDAVKHATGNSVNCVQIRTDVSQDTDAVGPGELVYNSNTSSEGGEAVFLSVAKDLPPGDGDGVVVDKNSSTAKINGVEDSINSDQISGDIAQDINDVDHGDLLEDSHIKSEGEEAGYVLSVAKYLPLGDGDVNVVDENSSPANTNGVEDSVSSVQIKADVSLDADTVDHGDLVDSYTNSEGDEAVHVVSVPKELPLGDGDKDVVDKIRAVTNMNSDGVQIEAEAAQDTDVGYGDLVENSDTKSKGDEAACVLSAAKDLPVAEHQIGELKGHQLLRPEISVMVGSDEVTKPLVDGQKFAADDTMTDADNLILNQTTCLPGGDEAGEQERLINDFSDIHPNEIMEAVNEAEKCTGNTSENHEPVGITSEEIVPDSTEVDIDTSNSRGIIQNHDGLQKCLDVDSQEVGKETKIDNDSLVVKCVSTDVMDSESNCIGDVEASERNLEEPILKEPGSGHFLDASEQPILSSSPVEDSQNEVSEQGASAASISEPTPEKCNDNLDKEILAFDISAASSSPNSLEGNWGSVSVLSTQSDAQASVGAETLLSSDSQAPAKPDKDNIGKSASASDEQQLDQSDIFEPRSFTTFVEPGSGVDQKAASSEIQAVRNFQHLKPESPTNLISESESERKKNEELNAKVTNWSTEKGNDKLDKQHLAADISAASSSRNSLEGNWGSVSVLSTQSDAQASCDAETLLSSDPQAPAKPDDDNLGMSACASDGQQLDQSDILEPQSFTTFVEPGSGVDQKAPSSEIQAVQNFQQLKPDPLSESERKKNEEVIAKVTNWSTGKHEGTPLKSLLGEAYADTKLKSPSSKQQPSTVVQKDEATGGNNAALPTTTVKSVLGAEAPVGDQSAKREAAGKEWNSPARYPTDHSKKDRKKVKGRPSWVPFVCCSSVNVN